MSMEEARIEFLLEDTDRVLHPGQELAGGFRLNTALPVMVRHVELSVLWYTEGKGDTDEGVIHHETCAENTQIDAARAFSFRVTLPEAPWSYDGKIVKIRWVVRVRIKPENGAELAAEERFYLLPKGRKPATIIVKADA